MTTNPCPQADAHGNPFRYCSCGWIEPQPDPLEGRHQSVRDVGQHFAYAHLPADLAAVSKPFTDLRDQLLAALPDSAELTVGLRKLLEAKDCCVRAAVAARED